MVITRDHGPQTIRWIGRRSLRFPAAAETQKPVLLPAGCLGGALPRRDLIVSPQHRILLQGEAVRDIAGSDAVLALAKGLMPLRGVRQMLGCREVTYHSLMFDRHEVIFAEGAPAESFYPGPQGMKMIGPALRAEIRAIFPGLTPESYGPGARPFATRRQAEAIARRLRDAPQEPAPVPETAAPEADAGPSPRLAHAGRGR